MKFTDHLKAKANEVARQMADDSLPQGLNVGTPEFAQFVEMIWNALPAIVEALDAAQTIVDIVDTSELAEKLNALDALVPKETPNAE